MSYTGDYDLTPGQKEALRKIMERYRAYSKTQDGINDAKMHRDHERYFVENLSEDRLRVIEEDELREIYKKLWASNISSNKDWHFDNKILAPNGIEKIRKGLINLLYGNGGIEERYDEFRADVKGIGSSSISEILHFVFPKKYCLWNKMPKTVLPALGLSILPEKLFKYQVNTGKDYMKCVRALEAIKRELGRYGIIDFIDLDLVFWYAYREPAESNESPGDIKSQEDVPQTQEAGPKIDSHQAAQYHLLRLGNVMGFATYTADGSREHDGRRLGGEATLSELPEFAGQRDIVAAKNVDVIWFDENENPAACFEVEHTTGISPGLHRLSQIMHYKARFFIVAAEAQRDKFDAKMKDSPYRSMTDSFGFISYGELSGLLESAERFYGQKDRLLWKG